MPVNEVSEGFYLLSGCKTSPVRDVICIFLDWILVEMALTQNLVDSLPILIGQEVVVHQSGKIEDRQKDLLSTELFQSGIDLCRGSRSSIEEDPLKQNRRNNRAPFERCRVPRI